MTDFDRDGWTLFGADPAVAQWAACALGPARLAVADPALAHWHTCQGTWFVGVDALANAPDGSVNGSGNGSGPLTGRAVAALRARMGPLPPLHRAQISVMYPGYPKPRAGESAAAFRYRRNRDAAHVDGVLAEGPDRRRFVREPHAFILGLPLTHADPDAAPLVVWSGSHRIMARAFQAAFAGHPPADWADLDVTDIYQSARREVFETCTRVPVPARPGEALLLHRLTLHGVAPWAETARAGPDGRMIAYFRPELTGGIADWPSDA